MTKPVLVVGASGKTGRRVVSRLAEAGIPYRPASRSTPFLWEQPSSWGAVLAGAGSAYVVHPELAETGASTVIRDFAEAAKAAGLTHLVLLSGRGEQGAVDSEQAVRDSGLSHTIVRASWFAQNYTEGLLLPGVLDGAIVLPTGGASEPVVDADDIADVVFAALTDRRHAGRTYEVTGAQSLTFTEMASLISAASGRPVSFVDAPPPVFRAGLATLVGDAQAAMFTALCQEIFDGRNENPGTGVYEALNRPPRTFTAFCEAAAASGVWSSVPGTLTATAASGGPA